MLSYPLTINAKQFRVVVRFYPKKPGVESLKGGRRRCSFQLQNKTICTPSLPYQVFADDTFFYYSICIFKFKSNKVLNLKRFLFHTVHLILEGNNNIDKDEYMVTTGLNPHGIEPNGIEPTELNPHGIEPNGIEPNGIEPTRD